MSCHSWIETPIGLDARRWRTRSQRRTVLVVAHTLTSTTRLLDIIELIRTDLRIQVVFTPAPDVFGAGVIPLLRRLDAVVIPWEQAVRTPFDLALAASYTEIHRIHAPVVLFAHGAGFHKRVGRATHGGPRADRAVYGLDRQRLVRDGRVIPGLLALSHRHQRSLLARTCPEALSVATVLGDPAFDQIIAGRRSRGRYREALGVGDSERLVMIVSTWSPRSLVGKYPELILQLAGELAHGRGQRLAAILHPNVWLGHSVWQVRSWFAECLRAGLQLVPPEGGWQAALVAADLVVGDHGSVSLYASALDIPIALTPRFAYQEVGAGSAPALLARRAPRLRLDEPLAPQLDRIHAGYRPGRHRDAAALITSKPGRFARETRAALYRLLRLSEPETAPSLAQVELHGSGPPPAERWA